MDFSPIRTPGEKDELFFKLQKIRAIAPLPVSGDIANHISILFNKTRKSTDVHIFQLIEKIQEFSEYWSQVIAEYEANKKFSASKNHGDSSAAWKDHDELELDAALERIQFLEQQLTSGADMLIKAQVKCADYDVIAERSRALEQDNENLKRVLKEHHITFDQQQPNGSPHNSKHSSKTLRGKLQEKMSELFELRHSITGSGSGVKKSSSTQSFPTHNNNAPSTPTPNYHNNHTFSTPTTAVTTIFDDDHYDPNNNFDQDDDALSANSQGVYSEDQQLLSEIEEFQKQIQSLVHEKNELLRVNMHLEEELHALQSQLVQWESKNQRLSNDIEKHQLTIQTIQQTKDTLEEKKTKIEVDYKNQMKINKVLIATVNKLENEIKENQSKYDLLSRENTILHTEIMTNKNQLLEMIDKQHLLTKQIQLLEENQSKQSNDMNQQNEKMNYLQTELIKEKERNASLQSDYEIINHEKERIAHALELTQKKLIQREETLEELLTINGLSTTPVMNTNAASVSGSHSNTAASNLANRLSAFVNRDHSTSPVPGSSAAGSGAGQGNLNNKIMQFALSAKQISMAKLNLGSKFKDAFAGNGNSDEHNNLTSTNIIEPIPSHTFNNHHGIEGNQPPLDDHDEELAANGFNALRLSNEGQRQSNERVLDEAERRLIEQFQTASMYPNES